MIRCVSSHSIFLCARPLLNRYSHSSCAQGWCSSATGCQGCGDSTVQVTNGRKLCRCQHCESAAALHIAVIPASCRACCRCSITRRWRHDRGCGRLSSSASTAAKHHSLRVHTLRRFTQPRPRRVIACRPGACCCRSTQHIWRFVAWICIPSSDECWQRQQQQWQWGRDAVVRGNRIEGRR
jgi:hypothetical protein